jgi:hypothetical protein
VGVPIAMMEDANCHVAALQDRQNKVLVLGFAMGYLNASDTQ